MIFPHLRHFFRWHMVMDANTPGGMLPTEPVKEGPMTFTITRKVSLPYPQAVDATRAALADLAARA